MENTQKNIGHGKHPSFSCAQSPNSQRNTPSLNSRGFALLLGVSLLPLLAGSLLSAFGIFAYLYKKNELLFDCERSLLKAQELLLRGEENILQLNPQIEQLVLKKRIFKKALVVTVTPVDRALIRAELLRIEILLVKLKARQIFLKYENERRAQQEMLLIQRQHLKKLRDFSRIWKAQLLAQTSQTAPQMRIVARSIDPSAKIYQVPPQMAVQQTLTLRWSLRGSSLFPHWIRFLSNKEFFWQDSCSTYPKAKEDFRWQAEIGAVTFF
jgi:hypothetical protein